MRIRVLFYHQVRHHFNMFYYDSKDFKFDKISLSPKMQMIFSPGGESGRRGGGRGAVKQSAKIKTLNE